MIVFHGCLKSSLKTYTLRRPASIWCATQFKMALRDKGVLDPMVMCLIWDLFRKILAAQLHHFQDKSPAYCNGWKT